jgi:hypothetical protein
MTQLEMIRSKRAGLQVQLAELFQIAFHEPCVRRVVSELFGVPGFVLAGDIQLRVGHVDTGHVAGRANQSGEREYIAPGAAAKVQHFQAVQHGGNGKAAAIIFCRDLIMHGGEGGRDMRRRAVSCGAGVGLQIVRSGQGFPIIGFHDVLDLVHAAGPCAVRPLHIKARAIRRITFWCARRQCLLPFFEGGFWNPAGFPA